MRSRALKISQTLKLLLNSAEPTLKVCGKTSVSERSTLTESLYLSAFGWLLFSCFS